MENWVPYPPLRGYFPIEMGKLLGCGRSESAPTGTQQPVFLIPNP